MREIGNTFRIKSPNGVMCHLNALVIKGLIVRERKNSLTESLTSYREAVEHLREQCIHLQTKVETLERQVDELKDEAQVREGFITDIMEQTRCVDCQRQRKDWY